MARKKYAKKKKPFKRYGGYARKKYYKRRSSNLMGRGSGFPTNKTVKMRYVTYVEKQPTVAGIQNYYFRANGVYDPDQSGTGHQPLSFDQWTPFYNHYRVLGARCTATLVNGAQMAGNGGYITGIYLADDTTTPVTWEHLSELKKGTQKVIAPNVNRAVTLTCNYSTKKFFSKNFDKGNTNALVTADPVDQAFFCIYVQPLDQLTTAGANCQMRVIIDYIVTFFEPKDLVQS